MENYLSLKDGSPIGFIVNSDKKYNNQLLCIGDKKGDLPITYHDVLLKLQIEKSKTELAKYERAVYYLSKSIDPPRKLLKEVSEVQDLKEELQSKVFSIPKGDIEPVPNLKSRDIYYIAAPSGSGKTVFCSKYAMNYNKIYPDNKIFVFSRLNEDPVLDMLPNLKRVDIKMLTPESVNLDLFTNSLVIFDDCETIPDKKQAGLVRAIMEDLLECGRHKNASLLITSHLINKNDKTRIIMNELKNLVIFPGGQIHGITYCLQQYLGFSKQFIQQILKIRSRWINIHTHHPRYVMWETGCFLL